MKTRRSIALTAIGFLLLITAIDLAVSQAPNPYLQPSIISLGSGKAPSGQLCTSAVRVGSPRSQSN